MEEGPPRPPPDDEGAVNDAEEGPPRPDDLDDVEAGPELPRPKKRRILPFEQQYLDALPSAAMYEKSYMHRDTMTHVAVVQNQGFIITGSIDGHIKFWKKQQGGIEFAKHFKAHVGPVDGIAVSPDGELCASVSRDRTVKVFDVGTFDMISMTKLPFLPRCAEWCHLRGDPRARLAVSDDATGRVVVLDGREASAEAPLLDVEAGSLHRAPVTAMRFNAARGAVVSTDEKGLVEYWDPKTGEAAEEGLKFKRKIETDLFAMAKVKTSACSMDVSKSGDLFVCMCADRRVRVFQYDTGKLKRAYDESLQAAQDVQQSGAETFHLEDMDFGRRAAVEKELTARQAAGWKEAPLGNAVFDESGHFVIYATLLGIKVVNIVSNKVSRVLGKVENTERFVRVALYQGNPGQASKRQKLSKLTADTKLSGPDPVVVATSYKKDRFYLFTTREPEDNETAALGRDVFNEKPKEELDIGTERAAVSGALLPRGAVMHTTLGDIWLRLFPEECPRTVENFTTHAKNGYYNGLIFHRVIKGFMAQTGDPLGDGTGGTSIWGGEFEDEFDSSLRHDRAGTLSMANSGPNTNGSQFFITTVPTPWLDNKHTVFGRVVRGMDVVRIIEKVKTDKEDKPLEDVQIVDIGVKEHLDEKELVQ
ncbi:unnamed protein product [Pedinophyceae sp. YPF-701]|nr:unnamed protein product [Pedinophyceae sp. YPF-701]